MKTNLKFVLIFAVALFSSCSNDEIRNEKDLVGYWLTNDNVQWYIDDIDNASYLRVNDDSKIEICDGFVYKKDYLDPDRWIFLNDVKVLRFVNNNTLEILYASGYAFNKDNLGPKIYSIDHSYRAINGTRNSMRSDYTSYYNYYGYINFYAQEGTPMTYTYVISDGVIVVSNGDMFSIVGNELAESNSTARFIKVK